VLADEPTANLDSATGYSIIELMRDINHREQTTFIFSTHDLKVMERADRIVRIADGRIQAPQAGDPTPPTPRGDVAPAAAAPV
jgi:putative ABC transport system ATP-binding protein